MRLLQSTKSKTTLYCAETQSAVRMAEELISELEHEIQLSEDVKVKLIEEELTLDSFKLLTEADLKELGFKMGTRKLTLKWIQSFHDGPSSTSTVISSSPVVQSTKPHPSTASSSAVAEEHTHRHLEVIVLKKYQPFRY